MMLTQLKQYVTIESTGFWRYWIEQLFFLLFSWIPSLIGVAIRALTYPLLLSARGKFIIQTGVILKQPRNIMLHDGVYLDHRVYLHASPNGIEIGSGSRIMYNSMLHVYNFRNLPNARIVIGENTVIGPYCTIYGHGGTIIGNNIGIAARVSILPINHNYLDLNRPIRDQGIEAKGVIIEDDCWIGAGTCITDGVKVGKGSVVGAGSVLTKDVPPYTLVAGVPAKKIKSWQPLLPSNK